MPRSVKEATLLDAQNSNDLCWESIMLEMKNVRPAFEVHEGDAKYLVDYQ